VSITAEELVPGLDDFDPSILELLPAKLRKEVEARVQLLKTSTTAEKRKTNAAVQQEELLELRGNPDTSNECRCEKCGETVSPFEMPEHMDFHLAKELQAEMRQQPMAVRTVFVNSAASKRKNSKSEAGNSEQPSKKQKNIMSFFGKKD
jgi:hypothetical protein